MDLKYVQRAALGVCTLYLFFIVATLLAGYGKAQVQIYHSLNVLTIFFLVV